MSTMVSAPPPSTRAQDILKDMRQKRELLVSSNPSLQRNTSTHNKPPTAPKTKTAELSSTSAGSSTRAQEILGDMKQKRASLTAVLEACKSPGSSAKKRDRSIGLSTAPTAASTRSWLSSIADDDDSICYSETSRESRRQSSIEFIIDTEESDLNSISTREEIKQAVAAVCNEVIPKVLVAIKRKSSTSSVVSDTSKKTTTTTSWTFQTQSSARNLYKEESLNVSLSEKKKRRSKISERKRQQNASNSSGSASSLPIDMTQLRSRRSNLQSLLDTISEMKEATEFNAPLEETRSHASQYPRRQPRQDDSSEGAAPVAWKPSTPTYETKRPASPSLSSASTQRNSLVLPALKDKKRTKKSSNSSLASHYVLDTTRVKQDRMKTTSVTATASYRAPTSEPTHLLPSLESDSEDSLLASPNVSDGDDSLLVTPDTAQGQRPELPSKRHTQRPGVSTPIKEISSRRHSRLATTKKIKSPQVAVRAQAAQDTDTHELQSRANIDVGVRHVELAKFDSRVSQQTLPAPYEPMMSQRNVCRDPLDESKRKFTYDDIVKEMELMAAKLAKDGLKIPIGVELKLRRGLKLPSDDNSTSGWSFSAQSLVSDCTMSLPSKRLLDGPDASVVSSYECANTRRSEKIDVAQRFCGGMYHLAVLSGMPPCEDEV